MRNLVKYKHTGITLAIIGIALLSLNFLSYLMNSPFVSTAVLPVGVLLLAAGVVIMHRTRRKQKSNDF